MADTVCDRCAEATTTDSLVEVTPATWLDPPEYLVICEACRAQDEIGREPDCDAPSWPYC
jgi:hypothetical protein